MVPQGGRYKSTSPELEAVCHAPGIFRLSLYLFSTSSRLTQDIRQEIRDNLCLLMSEPTSPTGLLNRC